MAETYESDGFTGLPSSDELGRMLDLQPQIEAPRPTGPADTWDILWYRLRQGFQNSLISNVADSLSLMGSSNPDLARFQLRRQHEIDLYKSNPSAATAVAQGRDGGFAGDVAQGVGQHTDLVMLLVFLSALFIRFIRGHKENILKRISHLGLAERLVLAGSIFWVALATVFMLVFEPYRELMKTITLVAFPPVAIISGYFLFYKWALQKNK